MIVRPPEDLFFSPTLIKAGVELLVEEQVLQGIGMAGLICLVQSLLWVEPLYRQGVL